MKKAKRLLAVLLAAVMLFSAASIPTYAYTTANNYYEPHVSNEMYWFDYQQGCGYLLDLLDDLLADASIYISVDELDDFVDDEIGISLNLIKDGILGIGLNLDDYLKDAGSPGGQIDLRSVDGLITTLYGVLDCLDSDNVPKVLDRISGLYDLLGDINDELNMANLNNKCLRSTTEDSEVLEMIILWLYNHTNLLVKVIAGTFDWGELLGDMIGDLLGGDVNNIDTFLKSMLYTMLVDDSLETIPAGETIDSGLQKVINWALEGTGSSPDTGSNSILGADHEGLMPGVANNPNGGASITAIPIKADRDLDGVAEDCTMSTYQLVANVLEALMGGMLSDMLSEVLYDALDIEITEKFPYGDPEIMSDETFSLIVGLVESLLVQNGAPEPEYTDDESKYPALKIDAMLDWLFSGGGLDAFIRINYQGIHIQDNFMSLLNDLIRLLVNMLPSLGLFESAAHLSYSADEMNAVWYYNDAKQLVAEDAADAVDVTYVTYETNEVIYATEYQTVNQVSTPVAYNYLESDMPVNIANDKADDYVNPKFIRTNYVIATNQVYATVIKMALYDMIDGCYFPEWTTDIPSVLAYGLAALAAPAVPENNFYERLDAYHQLTLNGGVGVVVDANGEAVEPIPYTTMKVIPVKDSNGNVVSTKQIEVPSGALSIGASYLAAYLNTILKLDGNNLDTDTTAEQFAGEFLLWACREYIPMLAGEDKDGDLIMDNEALGTWAGPVNAYVRAVYEPDKTGSYAARKYKETANFDAVYDLIDATLFSLIPTSWLPSITSSSQLINEWLLGNLIEFDLQGILGLLSVNMDPNAELNKPLLEVLLLVIDRVLAIVFNDRGLLLPDGRTNVVKSKNYTTIKSLDALLSSKDANGNNSEAASLPVFIRNLISFINTYKSMILGTVLPFLVSDVYERPYDTDVLGTNMTKYKIQDLENYIDSFTGNINATAIKTFTNEDDAAAAADGDAVVQRVVTTDDAGNITSTTYQIKLNNDTIYDSYATKEEADAVVELLKDSYVYEQTENDVTTYTVYANWSYLDTAKTVTVENDDEVEGRNHIGGEHNIYSEFQYANLTGGRSATNPFVSYETGYHRFFAYEDWGEAGFYYAAVNNALEEADDFVSSYRGFAEGELSDAYGEWFMYSIEAQLKANNLYDGDDDGVADDEDPGIPSAVYPFSTTDATNFAFKDSVTGETVSVKMNEMNAANYEQLAMAIAYGEKEENDVRFGTGDVESIVRLALKTTTFDITPYATAEDGTLLYNAGSKQWNAITDAEFETIIKWCTDNGLTCGSEILEDGSVNYWIARPAFKLLDAGLALNGVAAKPLTDTEYDSIYGKISMLNDTNAQGAAMTYADDVKMQIHKSYKEYVTALHVNRRGIYNMIDLISYRYERAEGNRIKTADTTMLKWIKDLSTPAYKNTSTKLRNYKYTGDVDVTTGDLAMTKIYTSSSFSKFKEAYEYADSIINAVEKSTMAANEFTQSLITEAYLGLLKAYLALVDYTGAASWEQLDSYMAIAYDILTDENRFDDILGYETPGLTVLERTYSESDTLRNDPDVDDERQTEVDNMAAALRQAINALVYKTAPSLTTPVNGVTDFHITSEDNATRLTGQVFGLEEGIGAVLDIVELVGMRLDISGNTLTITGSGKGVGTGAYYSGRVGNSERFRYFAVLYGDINGDARIDGTDATSLELYTALGTLDSLGSTKYEAADADHDGKVDEFDVAAIVDHYTFVESINQTTHSTSTDA